MQRPMKLRCTVSVSEETPSMYRVTASHFDGTPVTFKTSPYNVEVTVPPTPENPAVLGLVHVVQEARQDNRVAITLPSPSIEFGKNISVHADHLMPFGLTINNFKQG